MSQYIDDLLEKALVDRMRQIAQDIDNEIIDFNGDKGRALSQQMQGVAWALEQFRELKKLHQEQPFGIEMIAKAREEQINNHGFDAKHDQQYLRGELLQAALFTITCGKAKYPFKNDAAKLTILAKPRAMRLAVAGAFIAAEIDRYNYLTIQHGKEVES